MVKADLPSHSRDSSPDKVSSQGSLVSRTNSSASSPDTSTTISTTRESSPDYRLEISIPESGQDCVSTSPANVENNQEKTPIAADSPLFNQVGEISFRGTRDDH